MANKPNPVVLEKTPERNLSVAAKGKWRELQEMSRVIAKEGLLCPVNTAAGLLDLSPQRVNQLMNENTLRYWEFLGRRYVRARDLAAFVELERKAGRPWKKPCAKDLWKSSVEEVKEVRRSGSETKEKEGGK